jgi:hypothetical protein
MWRSGVELLVDRKVNFVLAHGSLGDVITSLPAIIHARETHVAEMEMSVWVPHWLMDLVAVLLYPYGDFTLRRFEDFPIKASDRDRGRDGPTLLNYAQNNIQTRCRVDMVDFAFATFLDARPESPEQRSYPTGAPLGPRPKIPSPYVVVPTGATSKTRLLTASVLGPILEYVVQQGLKPVISGTKKAHVKLLDTDGKVEDATVSTEFDQLPQALRDQCLDLRDETTLVQLRDLCGYALAVVGVDGGTLHLTGTTHTPIVYGCTNVLPVHRGITREGHENWKVLHVLPRELECVGCQSNWTLMIGHKFTECIYGDYACTKPPALHPEDFINALQQLTRG